MERIFETIIYFLERLSLKPRIGGLQITDSAIQYVLIKDRKLVNFGLRLPPGVLKGGKLQNPPEFSKILNNLHELIAPLKPREIIKIIVALPAEIVYTQSFGVPNINEEKLKESSLLNLQMISPIPAPEAYMSYQIINETSDRYELLGAFTEKKITDQFRSLLQEARFEPVIFEFPAIALARVVNHAIGIAKEPILILQISSDGLTIFLFRHDSLHFNYFRPWQSVQGDAREISKAVFESVVIDEVQRVVNFAMSRFKEVPKQALIIMPGLESEIKELLEKRFELQISPLIPRSYNVGPNWFTALGAAIRGNLNPKDDVFIALGTEGGADIFYEERILNFIRLWRNVLAGVIGFFLIIFGISAAYLVGQTKSLEAQIANISILTSEKELQDFKAKAGEFNNLVQAVSAVRGEPKPWLAFFKQLTSLAEANRIILDRFTVSAFDAPIALAARAPDHNSVLKFKNILTSQPNFANVDLPLSTINVLSDNSVSFNVTFSVQAAN